MIYLMKFNRVSSFFVIKKRLFCKQKPLVFNSKTSCFSEENLWLIFSKVIYYSNIVPVGLNM